jgi:hypothetical protein
MMRALKLICALAAVALIVGEVGAQHRTPMKAGNHRKSALLNSEPAKVLAKTCGNCHSDHTDWPWYSNLAPLSWWIARDVREGRKRLDFSEWDTYSQWQRQDKLESICGLISTGRMPPWQYTAMHPRARLTQRDKNAVCAWVKEEVIAAK